MNVCGGIMVVAATNRQDDRCNRLVTCCSNYANLSQLEPGLLRQIGSSKNIKYKINRLR